MEPVIELLRPVSFRGKHRLLAPIVPRTGEREATVFGYRMQLDLQDHIQRSIYMGTYEPGEVATFRRLLRSGMTFLDVGANVGFFSILAASIVGPRGRVIAVEPSPYACGRLRDLVQANGIRNVDVVHAGLSDSPGTLPLWMPVEAGNHTPTMTAAGAGTTRVDVPVLTLDRLLDERGVAQVDVMKIDVEGHEPRVFAGGLNALSRGRVRDIVCEFNRDWLVAAGTTPAAMRTQLLDAGFTDLTPARTPVDAPLVNRHFRWQGR